jgi:hypothetical protein
MTAYRTVADVEEPSHCTRIEVVPIGQEDDSSLPYAQSGHCGEDLRANFSGLENFTDGCPLFA